MMSSAYLTDAIVLLAAAVLVVPLTRLVGLGAVPGFLLAGIIVGPSVTGLIDNAKEISHIAELGVVLLLFVIGIELKPSRLWLMRRHVFGLGAAQVLVTGAALSAIAHYGFGVGARAATLIGPAMALSSTAFVLQLLIERKMLASNCGRASLAILLFQDLAVVPLLALVPLLGMQELSIEADVGLAVVEAVAILGLIIVGGRYLLPPIFRRVAEYGSADVFTAFTVLLVLGSAALMASAGLSMAMGAFVAGLLVANSEFRHQVVAEIQPFRALLVGLFFMSMGMSLDLDRFFDNAAVSIGLVLLLMLTKGAVLWPLAKLFGLKGNAATATAFLLAQSGEFALVLFAVAFETALLDHGQFQQLLVIVVLSMLATPPLANLAQLLAGRRETAEPDAGVTGKEADSVGIIIVGFGRVGRRIGRILAQREVKYVAVDPNASVVREAHEAGLQIAYGDARQPDVLRSLGVADARLLIVTVNDFRVAEQVVSSAHRMYPELKIIARAHDREHCRTLTSLGARLVVSENLEASIALARDALMTVIGDETENQAVIERYRQEYYSDE